MSNRGVEVPMLDLWLEKQGRGLELASEPTRCAYARYALIRDLAGPFCLVGGTHHHPPAFSLEYTTHQEGCRTKSAVDGPALGLTEEGYGTT